MDGKQKHLSLEPLARIEAGHSGNWFQVRPRFFTLDEVLDDWSEVVAGRGSPGNPDVMRVYAHFPFCRRLCRYCMYWSRREREGDRTTAYVDYLIGLIDIYFLRIGRQKVKAAYLGGGTPSLPSTSAMARFLGRFTDAFDVEKDFTCEANPDSLTEEKIALLSGFGVNRLSLGVQSLDGEVLNAAGRSRSSPSDCGALIGAAIRLGMSVNVDLVAGLPGQPPESVYSDLDQMVSLGPDQVTVYRYQPVQALADRPRSDMSLTRLFNPRVLDRFRKAGYQTWAPETEWDFGVVLQKPGTEDRLSYSLFDDPVAHLMGLGTGAFSHVYGRSWIRDVTGIDAAMSGGRTTYVGSRLDPLDEARTLLRRELLAGRLVDASRLADENGIEEDELLGPLKEADHGIGILEFREGGFRLADGSRKEAVSQLISCLTPMRSMPVKRQIEDSGFEASAIAAAVEHDLVPFGLDEMISGESSENTRARRAPPSPVLESMFDLLGLPSEGGRIEGVEYEILGGDRFAAFVEEDRANPLAVNVSDASDEGPAYDRTSRYAVGYVERPAGPITRREEKFLRSLCRSVRLREAERATHLSRG